MWERPWQVPCWERSLQVTNVANRRKENPCGHCEIFR